VGRAEGARRAGEAATKAAEERDGSEAAAAALKKAPEPGSGIRAAGTGRKGREWAEAGRKNVATEPTRTVLSVAESSEQLRCRAGRVRGAHEHEQQHRSLVAVAFAFVRALWPDVTGWDTTDLSFPSVY